MTASEWSSAEPSSSKQEPWAAPGRQQGRFLRSAERRLLKWASIFLAASLLFVWVAKLLPPYNAWTPNWNELRGYVEYFAFACGLFAAVDLAWAIWMVTNRMFNTGCDRILDARATAKSAALAAFHRRYSPHVLSWHEITDELPDGTRPFYHRPLTTNCWFVLFGLKTDTTTIRPTRVVAISKKTGGVVYDGELNDEG